MGGAFRERPFMSRFLDHPSRLIGMAVLAGCLGFGGTPTTAFAITEQEAQEIAIEAYVYFYRSSASI